MRTQPTTAVITSRRNLLGATGLVTGMALMACSSPGASSSGSAGSSALGGSSAGTPGPPASPTPGAPASNLASPEPLTQSESSAPTDQGWYGDQEMLDIAANGEAGVEMDLRWGFHEDYDRVVIETSGEGIPGWLAQFVPAAATQGRGEPISLTGSHLLQVIGRGTEMPVTPELQEIAMTESGLFEVGGASITQVWLDRTFEDQFQLVLGTQSTQFRVFALSGPSRLVVDVKHPG